MTVIHAEATAAPHSLHGFLFFHVSSLFTGATELPKVPISECHFLVLPCTAAAANAGKAKGLTGVPLNFTGPPLSETFIHIQRQAFDLVFKH